MPHWVTIGGQEYLAVEPDLLLTHKEVVKARARHTKKRLDTRAVRG